MLLEELLVVDLGVLELVGAVVGGQQARGDDGLVKHARHVVVVVGADAFLVQIVHGVEELAFAQFVHVARGAQVFCHALVVGVVVVVAHHDDFGVGVFVEDAVGDVAAQGGGGHATRQRAFLATVARRPVHDDEVHHLAVKQTRDHQLVAGDEVGLVGDDGTVRLAVGQLEILGVVEQSHVDATAVGRLVVHDLIVTVLDFGLAHEVFQHRAVLDLRHAEDGHAVGRPVGADGGDGVGHVVEFGEVFLGVPLVGALRQELLVVFVRVVDGVEEVLEVIEADEADLIGLLLLGGDVVYAEGEGQNCQYKKEMIFHRLPKFRRQR